MTLDTLRSEEEAETAEPRSIWEIEPFPILSPTSLRHLLKESKIPDAYCNSALYYMFTGRGHGWRLSYGKNSIVLLLHPNISDSILAFFPFAHNHADFLYQVGVLANYRSFITKFKNVFLARIPQPINDFTFGEHLNIDFGLCHLQRVVEEKLDWAYPSYDVSLERLADPTGGDLALYRKKIRKFRAKEIEIINIKDLARKEIEKIVMEVAQRWVLTKYKQLQWPKDERNRHFDELLEPYISLTQFKDLDALNIDGLAIRRSDGYIAFSFWETPPVGEIVTCMAALPYSHEKGLSEYLYHCIAKRLVAEGHKTMCIGGSETASLDRFKRKLAPIAEHHLSTLKLTLR
jgi:hypothetical protein